MNRKYILLTILSLLFISNFAKADTRNPYKFEMLQGLTQSSDTVVTATIESVEVGQRGDIYRETTDTQVKCKVKDVFLGAKKLKAESITVVFGAGDEPIQTLSENPVLLILRKEGENYRLSFFHTYGVFRLVNNIVQVLFEPKNEKVEWSLYSLKEIISRIKKYSKSKIDMDIMVAKDVSFSKDYLPVVFKFKNVGKKTVLLLPPSYCYASMGAQKITKHTETYSEENYGWDVDHWEFLTAIEPLLELKTGQERIYKYQIPLKELHIKTVGEYAVYFNYHQYQLSSWGEEAKITDEQMQKVWLGVPQVTEQIISVK